MTLKFLTVAHVIKLHDEQIEAFGGDPGIRDEGLIESATAMPAATFGGEYLHNDLFLMAAAYLYHISMNHGFVDGNKRTGLAAALVFLEINGIVIDESFTPDLYKAALAVAQGLMNKAEVASKLGEMFWSSPDE